jgi:hypothetical protein
MEVPMAVFVAILLIVVLGAFFVAERKLDLRSLRWVIRKLGKIPPKRDSVPSTAGADRIEDSPPPPPPLPPEPRPIDQVRRLAGLALLFALIAVIGVSILTVAQLSDTTTTVAKARFSAVLSLAFVSAGIWVIIIQKPRSAVVAMMVFGALLTASGTLIATVTHEWTLEGTVDVRLENWAVHSIRSNPFPTGEHCSRPEIRQALKDSILPSISALRAAEFILVLGQVDRRRLARPAEEWVRTDLELAQARAQCAREILEDSIKAPVYTLVGGPSYLSGADQAKLRDDRRLMIMSLSYDRTVHRVKLERGRVRMFRRPQYAEASPGS